MSRDVKSTDINGINDGLERAIRRLSNKLTTEIKQSEQRAIQVATRNASDEIRRNKREIDERISRISSNVERRIETVQRNLGARIDAQAKEMNRQLAQLDRRHTEALQQVSDTLWDALEAQGKVVQKEVERIDRNIGVLANGLEQLSSGLHGLERDVDRRFDEQEQRITAISRDVKKLFDMRQADDNAKILAAGQALAILEAIRERTPVDRFAPIEIRDRVAQKESRLLNVGNNPSSFTISDANALIDEAIVMEKAAQREQARWMAKQHIALMAANALLRMMQESMQLKVSSLYDENQLEELQTDYWTHGAFSKIEIEVRQLEQRIESGKLSVNELEEAINKLQQLQKKADELRMKAVELGILSENRVIVSNDILNVMLAQGWELKEDPGFMGGETDEDMREGTFAILKKTATGEELSILVIPKERGEKVVNTIIFHRNDETIEAPTAFQTRMEQIKREIEKSGYKLGQLGEPQCGGDGKIPQLRQGNHLRKAGASKQLENSLSRH